MFNMLMMLGVRQGCTITAKKKYHYHFSDNVIAALIDLWNDSLSVRSASYIKHDYFNLSRRHKRNQTSKYF